MTFGGRAVRTDVEPRESRKNGVGFAGNPGFDVARVPHCAGRVARRPLGGTGTGMRRRRAAALIAAAALAAGMGLVATPAASAATCPTVGTFGAVYPEPSPGVDWSGCSLFTVLPDGTVQGARLEMVHLEGANLSGADLRNARIIVADLTGADLSDATFDGARLDTVTFLDADLSGADFRNAVVESMDVRGADFTGALLDGGTFNSASGQPIGLPPG